jgi:hypothetical protein
MSCFVSAARVFPFVFCAWASALNKVNPARAHTTTTTLANRLFFIEPSFKKETRHTGTQLQGIRHNSIV